LVVFALSLTALAAVCESRPFEDLASLEQAAGSLEDPSGSKTQEGSLSEVQRENVELRNDEENVALHPVDSDSGTINLAEGDSNERKTLADDEQDRLDAIKRKEMSEEFAGDAHLRLERERRQIRRRESASPAKPVTTPKPTQKPVTKKSDIVVGEDRKRTRGKGVWGR
jgi:hypothetical protein